MSHLPKAGIHSLYSKIAHRKDKLYLQLNQSKWCLDYAARSRRKQSFSCNRDIGGSGGHRRSPSLNGETGHRQQQGLILKPHDASNLVPRASFGVRTARARVAFLISEIRRRIMKRPKQIRSNCSQNSVGLSASRPKEANCTSRNI